jgi:hypothetical protein
MELRKAILESHKNLVAFKLWAVKHQVYVATVILVMDNCFDRNGPRAKERRKEILKCFQVVRRKGTQALICHCVAKSGNYSSRCNGISR